jgi:hypothetical protein
MGVPSIVLTALYDGYTLAFRYFPKAADAQKVKAEFILYAERLFTDVDIRTDRPVCESMQRGLVYAVKRHGWMWSADPCGSP